MMRKLGLSLAIALATLLAACMHLEAGQGKGLSHRINLVFFNDEVGEAVPCG
jgi:hypothetical protein